MKLHLPLILLWQYMHILGIIKSSTTINEMKGESLILSYKTPTSALLLQKAGAFDPVLHSSIWMSFHLEIIQCVRMIHDWISML